ncbi:MAG: secretin and TonB N-terminal domain-containing protein [Candidatus Omnitrophica bacterium]|nr:secretin and TonB N-terminal domain-containing protein [Candidatus Omnitrophota bacterium]
MNQKRLKVSMVCFGLIGFLFFVSYLAALQNISQAQVEVNPALAQEEQDLPLPETTKAENITVDFKDADIHDVLKILSYKSGVNIVAGQDVAGTVTLRLVDVHWERALDVILKNSGFVYERDDDIIRVTTVENLGNEELSTEIFVLNYAEASQVAESVKEILSERGRIKFDQRTNQVVITDIPTNLYKISKVVERLDRKTPQVMIEAKLIETVLDDDERLGIDWTLYASATGASRPITVPFVWDNEGGITGRKFYPHVDAGTGDFADSVLNGFPYAGSSDFSFGTLSFAQLQNIIEILKTRSDTKTLSNPRIVTLNNKEAVIHVGRNYNIPLYERNSSTGQMEITDYKEEEIGIKLTVTPHVNAQREIVVDLHPEVSSFLQFDNYGNVQAPVFSTRDAITQVMIKDGETIVIGGLIKEETVDYVKKVPILGDIPILKYLFSKTNKTVDTTDLMIFVTVKLLDSDQEQTTQQAKLTEE